MTSTTLIDEVPSHPLLNTAFILHTYRPRKMRQRPGVCFPLTATLQLSSGDAAEGFRLLVTQRVTLRSLRRTLGTSLRPYTVWPFSMAPRSAVASKIQSPMGTQRAASFAANPSSPWRLLVNQFSLLIQVPVCLHLPPQSHQPTYRHCMSFLWLPQTR